VAVLVTTVVPLLKVDPLAGRALAVTPAQLSVAPTVKVATALQTPLAVLTLTVAGQVATGFWLSVTTTSKLQVAVFPTTSVEVPVTVVVPLLNVEPLTGSAEVVTPGQLSVPPMVYVVEEEHTPGSVVKAILAGQVTLGSSASVTVTLNVQVFVLDDESVDVPVTVVTPLLKFDPLAGLEEVETPGQLSVPPMENVGLA
jgi:hypothetical protein